MEQNNTSVKKAVNKISQTFKNTLLSGYYPKQIKYCQEAYDYVRTLYGNKILCIVMASLLEMEINPTPNGNGLDFKSEYGNVTISFDFSPHNMDILALQKDFDSLNLLIPILMKAGKDKCPDKYVKNSADFTEFTNNFFEFLKEIYETQDDYCKKLYHSLFINASAEVYNARKKAFSLDRDIALASANSTILSIKNVGYKENVGNSNLAKLKRCVEKSLKAEIKYSFDNRVIALNSLGFYDDKKPQHFWAYLNQVQRIKECPEMW